MYVTDIAINKEGTSSIDCDINRIKGYIKDISETYLLIAFRIYEIGRNKSYTDKGYKNIVDFTLNELNFKKSTTYNFLKIVEVFGKDETGNITYNQLMNNRDYNYSCLTEMLSLSDKQLELVTPECTVKQIRDLKSETFQTSGKSEIIDVDTYTIAENGIEEIEVPELVPTAHGENVLMLDVPDEPNKGHGFLYLNEDAWIALRKFINLNNNKNYSDYEIIENIRTRLF